MKMMRSPHTSFHRNQSINVCNNYVLQLNQGADTHTHTRFTVGLSRRKRILLQPRRREIIYLRHIYISVPVSEIFVVNKLFKASFDKDLKSFTFSI